MPVCTVSVPSIYTSHLHTSPYRSRPSSQASMAYFVALHLLTNLPCVAGTSQRPGCARSTPIVTSTNDHVSPHRCVLDDSVLRYHVIALSFSSTTPAVKVSRLKRQDDDPQYTIVHPPFPFRFRHLHHRHHHHPPPILSSLSLPCQSHPDSELRNLRP